MNALKITLIVIGIFSFSQSFSQTVDQDFSQMDKNKDGKIDKSEFKNSPPPPPPSREAKPKKASSETQNDTEEMAIEDRSAPAASPAPISFENIDANGDGIIDMEEFKMNHTAIRKRPGSMKNTKN